VVLGILEKKPNKIACIVLAAGSSIRFGSPKQLAEFDGKSLIQTAIDEANSSMVDYVFLVLGKSSSEILVHLSLGRAQVVFNKNYQQGIASSIKCGVSNLPDDSEAAIIMVADQPFLRSTHLNMLIQAFKDSPRKIIALADKGEPRNPVLIPSEMFTELENLHGDEGARILVKKNSGTVLIDIPDFRVFFDVDTKASLLDIGKSNVT